MVGQRASQAALARLAQPRFALAIGSHTWSAHNRTLVRFFFLLLSATALLLAPRPAAAQDATGKITRAVGRVVETLTATAVTAVTAFQGELSAVREASAERPGVTAAQRTKHALISVSGVAAIGLILALIVLISAQEPLEAVARAAERDISASFWVGLLWQALAVPIVLTLSALLAVTIILIPAIPIAVLAWALAYSGAFTLGLFAVTLVLGRAALRRNTSHNRGALLSSLMCGMLLLVIVWYCAAFLVSVPIVGILARLVALALTWVAATVGLGAVVRSRAGTSREHIEVTTETSIPSWQTPTPVFGVVAARRPTPVSTTTPE